VLARTPAHAWWQWEGEIGSLEEAAAAARWDGPDQPGPWRPVARAFRDGHTDTWWALAVGGGPSGPEQQHRAVVVTTDAATLPDLTTW
jgi:hypothetical protein